MSKCVVCEHDLTQYIRKRQGQIGGVASGFVCPKCGIFYAFEPNNPKEPKRPCGLHGLQCPFSPPCTP